MSNELNDDLNNDNNNELNDEWNNELNNDFIDNKIMKCDKCNIDILNSNYRYHKRTNLHKSNCLMKSQFKNIDIICTAFKNRIRTYRVNTCKEVTYPTPEAFLYDHQKDIIKIIRLSLLKHSCIKVNFELFAFFVLPKSFEQTKQLKSFNTKYTIILNNTDISDLYSNVINKFNKKMTEFEHCESGWSFESISHLEININKYSPMRGGSFIDLPPAIKNTKSCINIKNKDNYCFLWSVVAALYPCKANNNRTSSYPSFSTILNTKGMSFPPTPNDIKIFEQNNTNISINIYGLDNRNNITGPLYMSNNRKKNHVDLLYFEKEEKQHYCLIKNLIRLVRQQLTRHKGKIYLCEACLQFFVSQNKYDTHACSKILSVLPNNKVLQFEHYERQQKINFVIYADFESLLFNHSESDHNTNMRIYKKHEPSCFAYYICCSHDPSFNKYKTYRGPNSVKYFIDSLIEDIKNIYVILDDKKPMCVKNDGQRKERISKRYRMPYL